MLELKSEVTGQCLLTNRGTYYSFEGLIASMCIRDKSRPFYRGLGNVRLSGHLVKTSAHVLLTLDPKCLFELEDTMFKAKPDLSIDTSEEIARFRHILTEALIVIIKRDTGIDLLK